VQRAHREAGTATTPTEPPARRVLVVLDASSRQLTALDEAADLAAALRAELRGLFVEDVNLLRLAELPFAREIASCSTAVRQLDLVVMERMIRTEAEQQRRALANAAQRVRVQWSFQVARGNVARTSREAVEDADMLIVGRESIGLHPLIPRRAWDVEQPMVVAFEGSPASQRALAIAAELTPAKEDRLAIAILAGEPLQFQSLQRSCDEWMRGHGLPVSRTATVLGTASGLATLAHARHARLVLIASDSRLLDDGGLERLLNDLDCPLALVR
jgi:nucleotide-binding universal stress UspA family protein